MQTEFAVLVSDVGCEAFHTIGVEDGYAVFANGIGRKADATRNSGEKTWKGGFPEALIVDDGIRSKYVELRDDRSYG